jgi:hypothetical protein
MDQQLLGIATGMPKLISRLPEQTSKVRTIAPSSTRMQQTSGRARYGFNQMCGP